MQETIVLYPSPGIGHIISMVEIAKHLLKHNNPTNKHSNITILLTTGGPYDHPSIDSYIHRIFHSHPSISFHRLPRLAATSSSTTPTSPGAAAFEFIRNNATNVGSTLTQISQTSTIKSFIIDMFCTSAMTIGVSMGIPVYYFFTSGAAVLALYCYFPKIHDQITTNESFKDLNIELQIPGNAPLKAFHMPEPVLDRNDDAYWDMLYFCTHLPKSKGIIVNSFEELEPVAVKAIEEGLCFPDPKESPPVYYIGPLIAEANDPTDKQHSAMSSGGSDPPRPPAPSYEDKGKAVKGKKPRYEIRLRSHRPAPTSTPSPFSAPTAPVPASTPSPFSAPTVSAPASTPSPFSAPTVPPPIPVPSQSANQPTYGPPGFIFVPSTPGLQPQSTGDPPSQQDIPTSSRFHSFPSQDVEHPSDNDSTVGNSDPPPGTLPMIEPVGRDGFYPCRAASSAITLTIRQQFRHPWTSWGVMTKDEKDMFFKRFKKKVTWLPRHEQKIKKNFHTKASKRLSEELSDARKAGKMPNWMGADVWNQLCEKWNVPAYREKCNQAKRNRSSENGGSLHTGGSIDFNEHARRMAEALKRPVLLDEVFEQTHVRKGTGDFVDERSRRTHANFEARLSQARSETSSNTDGSVSTPLDPAEEERLRTHCWVEAVGGKKKGRIYGIGNLAHGCGPDDSFTQASSSHSQESQEMVEMRQRLAASEEVARRALQNNDRLTRQFQSLLTHVLPLLPAGVRDEVRQEHDDQQQQDRDPQRQQQDDQEDSPEYSDY